MAANSSSVSTVRSARSRYPYTIPQSITSAVIVVSITAPGYIAVMSLRAQVEELLPNWERWYPSLFDAASDLGLIKAEVCDPGNLLLSNRHAKIRQRAEDAHREQWGGQPQDYVSKSK